MSVAKAGGGTIQLRQFNGGMVTDPRDPTANKFRFSTNFDTQTNPYKLTPYYDTVNGDTNSSADKIQNYCVALGPSSVYNLYGLGTNGTDAEVFFKHANTVGSPDLTNGSWGTTSNNVGSHPANDNLFVYYKSQALIYGVNSNGNIWSYAPTGSASWTDDVESLSYTNVSQGLVHSMNDTMYFGADNNIVSNNAGSWNTTALVLPTYLYITDVAEYGNYLAIVAAPLNGAGNSKVFLWDMSSTSWNIMVDCGEGTGSIIHTINGSLITISIATNFATNIPRVTVREYTTAGMEVVAIFQGAQSDVLLSRKQLVDNRLLFQMALTVDGTQYAGTWSISLQGKNFAMTQETPLSGNTPLGVGDIMNGFIKVLGFTFQSYTASSVWSMSKTDSSPSYTANALYQTLLNPEMPVADKIQLKQLLAVGAMYENLPSGAQVVVKYRVDGGSWTTVFTETTTGVVFTEPQTAAVGTTSFTDGKEYDFQIFSTGGAVITALIYKYAIISSNI